VLLLIWPFWGVIAIAIRVAMGKPVIYKQTRVGKDETVFKLWKFRTMTNERDSTGTLLPDAERLTLFGLFLRKTSLDELPQLINVLKGELSLVGPRPLLVRYLPRYTTRQRLRHIVKPGITGWAQVHGRNALDWDTRLELDSWYAEHWNLWIDYKILCLTFFELFRYKNVKAAAGAELDEFWGTEGIPEQGPRAFPVEENEGMPIRETHRDGI
jgi:lipopolysaccharide/colanic/teichoic acid biosynthesis glycosyltransferase